MISHLRMTACAAVCSAALFVASAGSTPVQWPVAEGGNGHYYELTSASGPGSWKDQHLAALSLSHAGLQGHLATITSAEEMAWIDANFFGLMLSPQNVVYLGGWNDGFLNANLHCTGLRWHLGDWRWITGEAWAYAPWAPFEPIVDPIFGCTDEFALSFLYHWYAAGYDRTGFNNLGFEYPNAAASRLVEYDTLGAVDTPPLSHPVGTEVSSWGAVKAVFR